MYIRCYVMFSPSFHFFLYLYRDINLWSQIPRACQQIQPINMILILKSISAEIICCSLLLYSPVVLQLIVVHFIHKTLTVKTKINKKTPWLTHLILFHARQPSLRFYGTGGHHRVSSLLLLICMPEIPLKPLYPKQEGNYWRKSISDITLLWPWLRSDQFHNSSSPGYDDNSTNLCLRYRAIGTRHASTTFWEREAETPLECQSFYVELYSTRFPNRVSSLRVNWIIKGSYLPKKWKLMSLRIQKVQKKKKHQSFKTRHLTRWFHVDINTLCLLLRISYFSGRFSANV